MLTRAGVLGQRASSLAGTASKGLAGLPPTQKPLQGVKVVELGGLAPVPHAGLVLADFGADVTVLQKEDKDIVEPRLVRGKKLDTVNLKSPEGVAKVRELCRHADVLLDPYRPGVLEKLGLNPLDLLKENEKLIVCRLTGYGQWGEMSQDAGHDINYVATSGVLPLIAGVGRVPPWPPINLLADFAGGGLTAAFGIVAALFQRTLNGGKGAIIDASMVEGVSYVASFLSAYKEVDVMFQNPFAFFNSKYPLYRCYETKDRKFMAVGSLEPQFAMAVFSILGLDRSPADPFSDPERVVADLEAKFREKTRDEWTTIFRSSKLGLQSCVTPVLDMEEAPQAQHHIDRDAFFEPTKEGNRLGRPAPRIYSAADFSRLPSKKPTSKL